MMSSNLLRNSGLNVSFNDFDIISLALSLSVFCVAFVEKPNSEPKSCDFLTPMFDVITIKVFLKLIFLPEASVT